MLPKTEISVTTKIIRLIVKYLKTMLRNTLVFTYRKLPISSLYKSKLKSFAIYHFSFLTRLDPTNIPKNSTSTFLHSLNLNQPVDLSRTPIFTHESSPTVSIIIPIYNKIDYTFRCLQSIHASNNHYSFEIIVVNDCSTDNSAEILSAIPNITLINNNENLGFIRSCNKGANCARGNYVLFLNNDTYVFPNWLDELIKTFENFPNAGLVGSKFIYPNGVLQEAGSIIWRDGSAWNYGRGDDPENPDYCYLRDVDYCSGASIVLPKTMFDALGEFDEAYLPAYGEDSDLALKVKQAGFRVLYQPLSQVIHFEGISSGKSTHSGVKHYQLINAEKLYRRWATVLSTHKAAGQDVVHEKERLVTKRILVVDACTPTPDQDAGSLKIFNFIKIFQKLDFKVTFIPDNFSFVGKYTEDLQRIGVECLYTPYIRSLKQHLSQRGSLYDFILSCRPDITSKNLPQYREYAPQAKVFFDTADLHFIREQRYAELKNSKQLMQQAQNRKIQELAIAENVDCTIVVSDVEKNILLNENHSLRVKTISAVHEISLNNQPFASRHGLVFIGGYQHLPNVDAVIYFTNEILPLIKKQIPDIIFYVIGSRTPKEVLALASDDVKIIGYIENLSDELQKYRISVNPLRYGAGIKGKIVSCMAYGLPCVGTSIAFEGMGVIDQQHALLANDQQEFANAVIQLYRDKDRWNSIAANALALAQKKYSFEAATHEFQRLLS